MSEEINKLKEYLQYRISELKDSRLFYCENDELKIVDAINGIVDLQQKVEQLEKENKELKQPQVFIDCENMEERYGRDLYEDYLKEKIEQLENIRKEAIEFTNSHFKQMVADEEAQVLLNILNKGE